MGNYRDSEQPFEHIFKIVIIGDAFVGKTFLLTRYMKDTLPKHTGPTIGVEFTTKIVMLRDSVYVKAQIWDTAGQEKYRSMTSAHYRKSVGALVVYDVTKRSSFDNVVRWVKELKSHAEPDISILLVGNKVDLVSEDSSQRQVPRDEAEAFAEKNFLLFQETSAVDNINVRSVFEDLLQRVYDKIENNIDEERESRNNVQLGEGTANKKSCACQH
eukprot:TRINITY_DN17035_c0_g1_i1.p1 TRINITY_DN17035_c0_g1~~TRINITY_DN17035_c0_g1_i1.p1  ORF type:complete len:215 (-),score=24.09 TRINITY_DN17035_c0_g1_i1:200-844(-)